MTSVSSMEVDIYMFFLKTCFAGAGEEESQRDGEGGGEDEEILLPSCEEEDYAGHCTCFHIIQIERADVADECGHDSNHYTYY